VLLELSQKFIIFFFLVEVDSWSFVNPNISIVLTRQSRHVVARIVQPIKTWNFDIFLALEEHGTVVALFVTALTRLFLAARRRRYQLVIRTKLALFKAIARVIEDVIN
jgi:hypothetical protein